MARANVARNLLDDTFRINSTDMRAHFDDYDAMWNYDPTAESDDTENHAGHVHLKQLVLEETYNLRTQVKRTIGASKDRSL